MRTFSICIVNLKQKTSDRELLKEIKYLRMEKINFEDWNLNTILETT